MTTLHAIAYIPREQPWPSEVPLFNKDTGETIGTCKISVVEGRKAGEKALMARPIMFSPSVERCTFTLQLIEQDDVKPDLEVSSQ